jgi:hypothetical protein
MNKERDTDKTGAGDTLDRGIPTENFVITSNVRETESKR